MAESEFSFEMCRRFVEQNRPNLVPPRCNDVLDFVTLDVGEMLRLSVVEAYVRGPTPGVPDILDLVSGARL